MSAPSPALPLPLLATGTVRHHRLRPRDHAFAYGTYFVMLPMRSWPREGSPGLRRNRFALLAFHDGDHGDGGNDALAWLDDLLQSEGVADADGEVWLQTYPRVLGHVFKPVSFWYCERADGTLAAIVAEVNNTFGERHCYLLTAPPGGELHWGQTLCARKAFTVSPFCRVQGGYRFRFLRTAEHIVARVDHDDDDGELLRTSVSGRLQVLTPASARRAFFGMPLMTLAVVVRIHWQALRLWAKRVPFVGRPPPPNAAGAPGAPSAFTTR